MLSSTDARNSSQQAEAGVGRCEREKRKRKFEKKKKWTKVSVQD